LATRSQAALNQAAGMTYCTGGEGCAIVWAVAEAIHTRSSSSDRRVALLGKGGFGEVELIVRREGRFQRLYARKRLLPAHQQDVELRSMFFEEARLAGMIRHPNVVSVLDVGAAINKAPSCCWTTSTGSRPRRSSKTPGPKQEPIPLQVCLRIAMQVADGLHAAHELTDHQGRSLGLVHRDVSPANILVGYDGVARVSDFGVARALGRSTHTATGFLKGKFGYMSPEQLRFEEPDRRSDLFALGVVLFELISARRLYANQEGMDGARRALNEPPPDLADHRDDVPEALVQLLFAMLAKQPVHRPETAKWVSNRLEAISAALAAEEGRIDVAEYLEQEFGAERQQQQAELSTLLAAPPTPEPEASRPRMTWPIWLTAVGGRPRVGLLRLAGAEFTRARGGAREHRGRVDDRSRTRRTFTRRSQRADAAQQRGPRTQNHPQEKTHPSQQEPAHQRSADVGLVKAPLLLLLLSAPPAIAGEDEALARRWFDEGRHALSTGRFAEARDLFRQSLEKVPKVGSAFNLAVALRGTGESMAAVAVLDRLLAKELGPLQKAQREEAEALRRQTQAEIGVVLLRDPSPPNLNLKLDGIEVTPDPSGAILVDAGSHRIEASAPGHQPQRSPGGGGAGWSSRGGAAAGSDPATHHRDLDRRG
jgi:serine/threonine protein kinase